ncbi:response regulator [Acidovorax sp. A1169]|uniref:response regulator n=1 Tax=Acidovorax sp. A1169 TaxID=3059524 RepID=UPI002737C773|nr:response regulator [Acidovorax sp. A1169]MDP4078202.1 response regulator [Acidovorax sp. A1169]
MRLQQIVVVEDTDEDFDTIQDAARLCGVVHPIVRANSGTECLRLLRSGEGSRYRQTMLVLLDLNTPGDDGREVLRQVRCDDALCLLPVVVLSASADARDLQFCYANGANAYHVKPVDHALHLKVLQSIFAYWLGSVVLPVRSTS